MEVDVEFPRIILNYEVFVEWNKREAMYNS